MAVTIKEVAALAGVSPSTVSRTCKNNPSISEETKEKVRQAMQQLGYEPGTSAAASPAVSPGLVQKTIGIILPPSQKETYENSFYLEAIRGISQFCNPRQVISTVMTGKDEELLNHMMDQVYQSVNKNFQGAIQLIGPVPAAVYKVNDIYRKILYMKQENYDILIKLKNHMEEKSRQAAWHGYVAVQYDFA